MKRILFSAFLFMLTAVAALSAQKTVYVYEPQVPILIERADNVLMYIRVTSQRGSVLNSIDLQMADDVNLKEIKSLKVFYSGTEADQRKEGMFYAPVGYIAGTAGIGLAANSSYSVLKSEIKNPKRNVRFNVNQPLFPGINYFWISIQMKPKASLLTTVSSKITNINIDNQSA